MHGDERFVRGAVRSFSPSENRQASRGIWRGAAQPWGFDRGALRGRFPVLAAGIRFPSGAQGVAFLFFLCPSV